MVSATFTMTQGTWSTRSRDVVKICDLISRAVWRHHDPPWIRCCYTCWTEHFFLEFRFLNIARFSDLSRCLDSKMVNVCFWLFGLSIVKSYWSGVIFCAGMRVSHHLARCQNLIRVIQVSSFWQLFRELSSLWSVAANLADSAVSLWSNSSLSVLWMLNHALHE